MQGDTGAAGIYGIGYTAQLGNGFSATISIEDAGGGNNGRGRLVGDVSAQVWAPVANLTTDNRGYQFPDVVANLRVDQAWGYAQLSAAVHDVAGGYYAPNTTLAGHPDDELGWAVSAGFTLNNVLGIQGDQFGVQAAFANGASGYVTRALGTWTVYDGGNRVGLGYLADAIFTTGTQLELTDTWGVHAFYQHRWTPQWKTSLYGGFVEVDYNANATAIICAIPTSPRGSTGAVTGFVAGTVSNCSPDYSWYQIGTRTQWNPHPDLDIGLDLLYTHLNTAFAGTATLNASGARAAGVYTIEDQDIFSALVRVQRNFLP